MKKIVLTSLIFLLLTGCTYQNTFHLQDALNEELLEAAQAEVFKPNRNKTYYSYYLYPYIGRHKSTQSGNVLNYRGTQFVMNLNISALINQKYYTEAADASDYLNDPAAEAGGEYEDYLKETHAYQVDIYEVDGYYLTVFQSDTVEFYSVSDPIRASELASVMLKMARSVRVDIAEVIAAYSYKETIDYKSEKIELFKSVAPQSGRIEELFEDYTESSEEEEKNENGPKQITTTEEEGNE